MTTARVLAVLVLVVAGAMFAIGLAGWRGDR
jgi:type IV secretory pathway VirB2 component (pilin)